MSNEPDNKMGKVYGFSDSKENWSMNGGIGLNFDERLKEGIN
jgi:hypothetical protein